MKVNIYLLDWHIKFSPAFHEIFINLFEGHAVVSLVPWNGKTVLPEWENPEEDNVFVFCQKRPPNKVFSSKPFAKVLWIPMWNNVKNMSAKEWGSVPKSMRILSYSPLITKKSIAAGLSTLQVRYAPNPAAFSPASWENGNILYYWNRVGMLKKADLIRLCRELDIKKLLFRPDLDPGIPGERGYSLTSEEAGVKIEIVPLFESAAIANQFISQANVVIAPRPFEGVGLTFLEAMAAGKAVLAIDRPTMSEYIEQSQTGVLLRDRQSWFNKKPLLSATVAKNQGWSKLKAINLKKIGNNARTEIEWIHKRWLDDIESILDFTLKWKYLPAVANREPLTDEGMAELYRSLQNLPLIPKTEKFYALKLRILRMQLHSPSKSDLRTINLRTGLKMIVDLKESSALDLYYGLFDEQHDFELFTAAIKSGDVVLDVGANMGIYSMTGAQRVGALGRVFAFEPNSNARNLLSQNIAINKLTRAVKIISSCVGDYDGATQFHETMDSAFSGMRATGRSSIKRIIEVPVITLDSFISRENLDRVDALKLDVEGFEANVLKGAALLLDRSDPVIMLEISNKNLTELAVLLLKDVLYQLEVKGFRMLRIIPRTYTMVTFQSVADVFKQSVENMSGNYFFARVETGKFDHLIKLHQKLRPFFGCQGRIFPGIPKRRFNRVFRSRSTDWAERKQFQIASELLDS